MSESRWIKVKDKKPHCCEDVLLTDGKTIFLGWLETVFEEEDPLWCAKTSSFREEQWPRDITHWMKLPKPPKLAEGSDED